MADFEDNITAASEPSMSTSWEEPARPELPRRASPVYAYQFVIGMIGGIVGALIVVWSGSEVAVIVLGVTFVAAVAHAVHRAYARSASSGEPVGGMLGFLERARTYIANEDLDEALDRRPSQDPGMGPNPSPEGAVRRKVPWAKATSVQ